MLHLDGQVHHDTHAVPMGNYVIAVGISLIVSPSEVGNCVIADIMLGGEFNLPPTATPPQESMKESPPLPAVQPPGRGPDR